MKITVRPQQQKVNFASCESQIAILEEKIVSREDTQTAQYTTRKKIENKKSTALAVIYYFA